MAQINERYVNTAYEHIKNEAITILKAAADNFVVKDLDRLFIQANVVNGRAPKEFTGYDPELEETAAFVALEPLLANQINIDAVMPIPRMGETFGLACWRLLEKHRGEWPHLIRSRKMSVDEASTLVNSGYGFSVEVDSYTAKERQAIFVPQWVGYDGTYIHPQHLVGNETLNFNPEWDVLLGDDFIAKGNAGKATVEGLVSNGMNVIGLCAYVSKHQQKGFDCLVNLHTESEVVTSPIFVSTSIAITGIEPFGEKRQTVNGESLGRVIVKDTVYDYANLPK